MIQLRIRTEYSFRRAYGKIGDLVASVPGDALGITDFGTWGHVPFYKACNKIGKKPLLGVEINAVKNARDRSKQYGRSMAFLAKNSAGLTELYALVSRANGPECFYYIPRIDYTDVNSLSENVMVLSGANPDLDRIKPTPNFYLEVAPGYGEWNRMALEKRGWNVVVCSNNFYPSADGRSAYDMIVFDRDRKRSTAPMHILSEDQLRIAIPGVTDEAFINTERIAAECHVSLPQAIMVKYPNPVPLIDQCQANASKRGIDLSKAPYAARLKRELALIKAKQFEDYFFVIADMVQHAKQSMLVGPARGSSAGSLVCFLLGITDVDPILHGLMFERFIDATREDLPDIDIDFPDLQREEIMAYLEHTYGRDHVGHIGTINRYKARSAIGDVAKQLHIPPWEIKSLASAIVERSMGDARAQSSIQDAFDTLDVAKPLIEKYPGLAIAAQLEGHARHHGKHAAGYLVVDQPLHTYCSVERDGTAQIDKYDAESLNLLKIDVLGLRTLTVLQNCLWMIGKAREWLVAYPLDDDAVFRVLNADRYAGIFQFEGYTLQTLARQMRVRNFDDIVALTSLARPGPLQCGAAAEFVQRRIGVEKVTHLHEHIADITKPTYGIIVFQEQVMAISRSVGKMSWKDVSALRKAMSKSLGEEAFHKYWEQFVSGATQQGMAVEDARKIWDKMRTFGEWAFNKSHAVSYGLISYWCAMLKAHHPLEFAASCLQHSKDDAQAIQLLRELAEEGIAYTAIDSQHSELNWSVQGNRLIGGLLNIKGVGAKKAEEILKRRAVGLPLTPGLQKLLDQGKTPFDDIFEGRRKYGDIYDNPQKHKVLSGDICTVRDLVTDGEYRIIAKVQESTLRDLNEYASVTKRGGRILKRNFLSLSLRLEDDTGSIMATIDRYKFAKWGKPILDDGKIGDWYLWKGKMKTDWRRMYITQVRKLD